MCGMVSATLYTSQLARDPHVANDELATKSDVDGIRTSITALFWVSGVHLAVTVAALATVIATLFAGTG